MTTVGSGVRSMCPPSPRWRDVNRSLEPARVGGARSSDRPELHWSASTTVGKVRQVNEDSFLALDGMFVVADGMGGHAAGDVASALVVDVFQEFTGRIPLPLPELERLVVLANDRVRRHAHEHGLGGMGTTVVGVTLVDNGGEAALAVLNVGDSRCYSWNRADGLVRLTHDHSVVQELIDEGSISSEEAERHPERNVVTRSIGNSDGVVADFHILASGGRHRLLLCSDGVSSQIPEDEIALTMERHDGRPVETVEALIALVMAGRAPDNATAIVVDVGWPDAVVEATDDDTDVTGPRPRVLLDAEDGESVTLIDRVPAGPDRAVAGSVMEADSSSGADMVRGVQQ